MVNMELLTKSVLILSLVLGSHNIYLCYKATKSKTYGPAKYVQLVASIFQLLNQGLLLAFFTFDASFFGYRCAFWQDIDFIVFFVFQYLSLSVLIHRATVFLKKYTLPARIILMAMLSIASAFGVHANVYREISINESGFCQCIWVHQSNLIHISIKFIIYLILLYLFYTSGTAFGKTLDYRMFKSVIFSISFRIGIAIFGYLISTVFAFAGIWGTAFAIEFSLENYCAITASTYEIKKRKTTMVIKDTFTSSNIDHAKESPGQNQIMNMWEIQTPKKSKKKLPKEIPIKPDNFDS
ncbi:hypothetical protein BC833DRAFT_605981 [Globomyces pollinis-pini]|nr:hypothetical protein BC833DRAFT_605981 [Globomyces pollinis-pini]